MPKGKGTYGKVRGRPKKKKGKKKMRTFGKVEIPHNAFIEALKMGDN